MTLIMPCLLAADSLSLMDKDLFKIGPFENRIAHYFSQSLYRFQWNIIERIDICFLAGQHPSRGLLRHNQFLGGTAHVSVDARPVRLLSTLDGSDASVFIFSSSRLRMVSLL